MFMYLMTCHDTLKPWFVFYKKLFETQPPDQILLTINRMMKGARTKQNDFFKKMARKIFKRLTTQFSLQYKNFQHMIQGEKDNSFHMKDEEPLMSIIEGFTYSSLFNSFPHLIQ